MKMNRSLFQLFCDRYMIFILALIDGVLENNILKVSPILKRDELGYLNANVLGPFPDTLLHIAASCGNYEMCRKLLECGADINIFNSGGQTPLHIAETISHYDICKLLVVKREEQEITYNRALHLTARDNELDSFRIHLESVDVNDIGVMKRTPLHVTLIFSCDEICDLLLTQGADILAKDIYNDTPIHLGFYYKRVRLRERMLENLSYYS